MFMDELIIDSFAGGGGASLGIKWATGREPDIAINHDEWALAMHEANHPKTKHVHEDVWKTDLRELIAGRDVGLLWASPDCKHFSRAKGGKPVEKAIRSLAWIVTKWADQVQPRVICLENVREFADWGPLVPRWKCRDCNWRGTEGQATLMRTRVKCPSCDSKRLVITEDLIPDPKRKGLTFKRFCGRLKNLGYEVEFRNLDAADYGAPTHRRRLFLIARRDGEPITWPAATHGEIETDNKNDGNRTRRRSRSSKASNGYRGQFALKPYRTAAECINWSIECPSIFERKRPLAEKTLRRIALGVKRYVLENERPFLVSIGYGEREGQAPRQMDLFEPLGTVVQSGKHALVTPILSTFHHGKTPTDDRCQKTTVPFGTLDTQPRYALVAPSLVAVNHGDDAKSGTNSRSRSVEQPLPTATRKGHQALVAPILTPLVHNNPSVSPDGPMPTVTTQGNKSCLVSAFLAKHFGGVVGVPVDQPAPTTTMRGTQNQLVAANLVRFNFDDAGVAIKKPAPTVTVSNHAALVYSFMVKYFGTSIGANLLEPMPTATGKDRFGLVTVTIAGETYVIVDIGMRMLTPRELARAQGFPDSYILTGNKTNQVARIGNSVCPPIAQAIVAANYKPMAVAR